MKIDFNFVKELEKMLVQAYEQTKTWDSFSIKNKELNDIVTDVDIFMERTIVSKLTEWFPEYSIYSEEMGETKNESEYEWLIDPIDGTINFSSGIPLFATSIALRKKEETIFGFIYDYTQKKCYYAIKGEGAYCNGNRISVSQNEKLSQSVISFCLTSHYNNEKINEVLEVEKSLASKVRGLRLIVSATIELAWCAEGKIDGCLNVKPSIGLSSAAGKLLVVEAGGVVTNCKGEKRNNIDTMLVTNGKIHKELVNAMKYTVFIGNTTEVIEISSDLENKMNIYLAGKAYSEAIAASKTGNNSKLVTLVSGIRKKELEKLYDEIKRNNIDTSYIKVSNDIENDLKIIILGKEGEKSRQEDILKDTAEQFSEEMIIENQEMIQKANFVVCQTKINTAVTKKLIEFCYENSIPVILVPSRPKNISIITNKENEKLLKKASFIICDEKEFKEIWGENAKLDIYLKMYANKLIVYMKDKGIVYHNGTEFIVFHGNKDEQLNTVGSMDVFVGNFVRSLCENNDINISINEGLCAATVRGISKEYLVPNIKQIIDCKDKLDIKIDNNINF